MANLHIDEYSNNILLDKSGDKSMLAISNSLSVSNSDFLTQVDLLITPEYSNTTGKSEDSLNSTSYTKSINDLNNEFSYYLKNKITPVLLSILKTDDSEFGTKGSASNLVEIQFENNPHVTTVWLSELFNIAFSEKNDYKMLAGILKIVEALDLDILQENTRLFAMCAFLHKEIEIQELGIRILENRCNKVNLGILQNIKIENKWLNNYLQQVIKDFEEILCQ